jgi:hypothetical protein
VILHVAPELKLTDEFGGPGERPKMTALPDGFPSNRQ